MYPIITVLAVVLTILGIAATCYFGAKSLKSKRRTKISYYEEDNISLFESIVQSIEGIEITYENKTIGPNLVLLKGCIVNTGQLDIDKSMIHTPLKFSLPESSKWLKAKIVSSSSGVNAEYQLSILHDLEFSWALLKPNEYFRFDALAETPMPTEGQSNKTPPQQYLRKNLNITHRITNVGPVISERLRKTTNRSRLMLLQGAMLIFMGLFIIGSWFFTLRKEPIIHYGIQLLDGEKIKVSLKGNDKYHLVLEGIHHPFKDEIQPIQLFKKYKDVWIVLDPNYYNYIFLSFGGITVFFGLFIVWFYLREIKKEKKKLRLVELLK